jgi:hypothetical protein
MPESPSSEAEPLWRWGSPTGRTDADGTRATRKLLLMLAATGLALGGLVGVASWFRAHPYPVLLPLFIHSGGERNEFATPQFPHDSASLRAGRWFSRVIGPGDESTATEQLGSLLHPSAGVRSDETLVTVLFAPARVGIGSTSPADATLVFVTPGGRELDTSKWVPLRDVLLAIDRNPARHVLLLLDLMRPPADPLRVQLADDVTDRIQTELAELNKVGAGKRLTVLCAASAGQVSWASEVWGRSVFLAYAEEALSGWADLEPTTGNRDGRVTLNELFDYIVPRVDRWAIRCRGVRQTPVLLGSRRDFPVGPRRREALEPRSAPPEDRAYPDWLEVAWSMRDRWHTEQAIRFAPWALRGLEAALLASEKSWRAGGDPARIHAELTNIVESLSRDYETARTLPHPVPRSLALAATVGEKSDERVSLAMTKLLEARADPGEGLKPDELAAARAKQLVEFQKATAGSSDFAFAQVIFQAVTASRQTPVELVFLDNLLRARQPDPLYIETLLLRRLADRARSTAEASEWPAEPVRLAFEAARRGEPAQSRPRSFSPLRPWLEAAARERHLGEIALFSTGFVSIDEADRRLRRSVELYDAVVACQEIIERSWNLRDEALAFLPAAVELLDVDRHLDIAWNSAVEATKDLDELLSAEKRRSAPVIDASPVTELLLAVAPIRSRMQILEQQLGALRRPFLAPALKDLIAQVESLQADAQTWRQLDAALATPFLTAKDRAAVWTAARVLERRLVEPTLSSEPEDSDRQVAAAPPAFDERGQPESLAKQAARRARHSIGLLGLAGQDPGRLEDLEKGREQVARGTMDWPKLGQALRLAWVDPEANAVNAANLPRQERVARVAPLELAGLLISRWSRDPISTRQSHEWTALFEWLSDQMQYQARDLYGLPFHAEAARGYNPPGRASTVPDVHVTTSPSNVTLTSRNRSANLNLQLGSNGTTGTIGIRFLSPPGDPATIRPDFGRLEGARQVPASTGWTYALQPTSPVSPRVDLPLLVERSAGSRFFKSCAGFLVQYQVADWPFTSVLPIDIPADTQPFWIMVGDASSGTTQHLLVRPGTGPTPLPIRVRNPTRSARAIVVELKVGDTGPPTLSKKQTIDAGSVEPVSFAPGPLPQGRLPSLVRPLRLRVLDADHPEIVLGEQDVRARPLPSTGYVHIEEILYTPPGIVAGDPNRLTVRLNARPGIAGPPCPVDLVLLGGRIPGFLSAEAGLFRVELPVDGKEMKLFAEGLRFEEGADGPGIIELNIDGVERAQTFQVRFNREGAPSLAERSIEPALRIRAPKFVKSGEPLAVVAVVDNAPDDASVELSLGRADDGPFQPLLVRNLDGPRDGRVGFLPTGPEGSPLVEASLQDWSVNVPTAGIQGIYDVRVRVRDGERRWLLSASARVIIDDTPPRWVKIARLPKEAKRGSPLEIRATAQTPLSGIREVVFFIGKALPDGKLPPAAATAPGKRLPNGATTWSGTLLLPADRKGPTDLSVQVISNVGLSTFDSGQIELIDTDPVATGSIRGRVQEASLPQSGLVVTLVNAKGEKLDTKSDKDGVFSFADVPIGKYNVGSYKPTSMRVGKAEVMVKPGVISQVELELLYQ